MKVAVLGATGRIGSQIALEAHSRGHDVTGVSRGLNSAEPSSLFRMQYANLFDHQVLSDVFQGHDAIISAYRGPPQGGPTVADAAPKVIQAARDIGIKRLIFVGGAGALEVRPGVRLYETESFPALLKPVSLAHLAVVDMLSNTPDLSWTVFSPAAEIGPGDKKGGFRVSERLIKNDAGKSTISYADFAVAVINELEDGLRIGELITAAYA